jgi:uncharacterized membrane protein
MNKIALLGLVLMLFTGASAAQISSYDAEAVIENGIVKESLLIFVEYDSETSIELLLPPGVRNLAASVNDASVVCQQKEVIGATQVNCPVPVSSDYFVNLEFETTFPIVSLDDRKLFSQDFSFNQTIREFNFRLKLPERAVLPEPVEQFVSPEPTRIYSDGRRIILSYEASGINVFDTSVIYEPAKGPTTNLTLAVSFLVLVAVGLLLMKLGKSKRKTGESPRPVASKAAPYAKELPKEKKEEPEDKLYLLPDEKGIIKILKDAGKPVRQRDIEKHITFSKAKLSRVLRNLEERGIIKRIPRGNTNLVELVKK